MKTCDVAVIGAGIVGAACAYELAASGLRVAVVEPNAVVSGATALAYGSLAVLHDVPGQFELTRYGLEQWKKLADFLPTDCEYRQSGSLWLATNEAEMKEAVRRGEFLMRQGMDVDVLEEHELAEAEPGLRRGLAGGLLVANDGWLRAGRAAEFLLQLALQNRAETIRQEATKIGEHEVRLRDGSILYAGNIVNAAGRHAAELSPEMPLELSKGHVMVVETEGECTRHAISSIGLERDAAVEAHIRLEIRQGDAGVNMRREVWLGSSYQTVAPERAGESVSSQVEPRIVAVLLRRAMALVPAVGRAKPLRSWTGLRSGTRDGLPLIGRVAGKDGIYAAAGHGNYGATAALGTAKLIADDILSRTPEIDPRPYRADR